MKFRAPGLAAVTKVLEKGGGPRGSPGPRRRLSTGVRGRWTMKKINPAAPAVCSDEPLDSTQEWYWSQSDGPDAMSWESDNWDED